MISDIPDETANTTTLFCPSHGRVEQSCFRTTSSDEGSQYTFTTTTTATRPSDPAFIDRYPESTQWSDLIIEWANYLEIDPMLALAVCAVESEFSEHAENGIGGKRRAVGLMQVKMIAAQDVAERLYQEAPRHPIDL